MSEHKRGDVEPHLRTEDERRDLLPRFEAMSDRLCQTQGKILWALKEAGLTVVLLDPAAREVSPISLAERVDHLTDAANDLRARLQKLTLEQAAKDQELEKYKSLAAAAGLHDACEERRGRELRNEQERWIRAEELNTRLEERCRMLAQELENATRVLAAALEQTGCDGDLCMYGWGRMWLQSMEKIHKSTIRQPPVQP